MPFEEAVAPAVSQSSSTARRLPILPWEVLEYLFEPNSWNQSSVEPLPAVSSSAPASAPQQQTRMTRITLNDGHPELAASTAFEGTLLNQFSLDEYEDCLRVAVTVTEQQYAEGERGEQLWMGSETSNSLLIFDDRLELLGSIENLAPGERIYSTRFTGEVGYMVTFRQTDPLFSLDLSDPRRPRVMDALKIPGFSEYLHPYADGLLLGIGRNTTNTGNLTGELKLSMFNISDPFDIDEQDRQFIDSNYTPALYNHKAVLIDEEKDLIGFEAQVELYREARDERYFLETVSYYFIYGYHEDAGFYERAAIELPQEYTWDGEARALYIDDYLYLVCGEYVGVYSLDTFEKLG
jgi:uncharacterized secreted protein with C-terminal beta-propeller domain